MSDASTSGEPFLLSRNQERHKGGKHTSKNFSDDLKLKIEKSCGSKQIQSKSFLRFWDEDDGAYIKIREYPPMFENL